MSILRQLLARLLHVEIAKDATFPQLIGVLAEASGPWMYVILFAIIFAETGLVVVPFLPGDSLLFAVGAVAGAPDSPINLGLTAALLIAAAVLGDAVNYLVGYKLGPAVFSREDSKLLNKKHLNEAHAFYEKYGAKTIILARFVPIVRTFAPFVAGVGRMNYPKFFLYNVIGGVVWVLVCLLAGYRFGRIKFVQDRFELVVVAIIVISILPALYEYLRKRGKGETPAQAVAEAIAGIDPETAGEPQPAGTD